MTRYRDALPQAGGDLFLTDGGLETTLIFHDGVDLPDFATFPLLGNAEGRATLLAYFRTVAELAKRFGTGLILESATWRSSSDWEQVDAETEGYPAYYMINCAHPTHFAPALKDAGAWVERIRGLRANASRMSHAELDEAVALDAGDPVELGREYAELKSRLAQLNVMGGCCGTDHRHIEQIAAACRPLFR